MTKSTGYFQTAISYKADSNGDSSSSGYSFKKSSTNSNSRSGDDRRFFGSGKPEGGDSNGGDNSGFLGGGKPKGGNSNGGDNSGFLGGGNPKGGQPFDNQLITGTAANDTLRGNNYGSDTLVGTTEVARGVGEYDILIGGRARDTFVLGDAEGSFYLGQGSNDYAEVKNFNRFNDKIQLAGSIQDYSISYANGISSVFHKDPCGCLDLVAQVNSACSPLDLNGSYFQYTPPCDAGAILIG